MEQDLVSSPAEDDPQVALARDLSLIDHEKIARKAARLLEEQDHQTVTGNEAYPGSLSELSPIGLASISNLCCSQCRKPVKNHLGSSGERRCIVGLVDPLLQRVDDLEKKLEETTT